MLTTKLMFFGVMNFGKVKKIRFFGVINFLKNRLWWPSSLRGHAISQLIVATEGPLFDIRLASFIW